MLIDATFVIAKGGGQRLGHWGNAEKA